MIRYIGFLCLILLLTISSSTAQIAVHTTASQELAELAYANNNYKSALKEYLRVHFQDRDNAYPYVTKRIADCFSKIGDPDNAIKYLNKYQRNSNLVDSDRLDSYYQKLKLLSTKNNKLALAELLQVDDSLVALDSNRYNYHSAMIYLLDNNQEVAKEHIMELSYQGKIDNKYLDELLGKLKKNENKRHIVSRFLSAAIPGLGQAVNGDTQDAINSVIINSAMVLVFFQVSKTLSLADALLSVVPWFARFYIGGMSNAITASKRKQARNKSKYIEEVNKLIFKASVEN